MRGNREAGSAVRLDKTTGPAEAEPVAVRAALRCRNLQSYPTFKLFVTENTFGTELARIVAS